jgi:hypothetical protein
MAVFTGQGVQYFPPEDGANGYMRYVRSGGMVIEIDPAPIATVILSKLGLVVDIRVTDDDNICRFYNLEPGNYIATSAYRGQTGTTWSIVVTPTTYSVQRITAPGVFGFIAQA